MTLGRKMSRTAFRPVTALSVLQFVFITGGYLAVRSCLGLIKRYSGQAEAQEFLDSHWRDARVLTACTLFVHRFGLLFLLSPALLVVIMVLASRTARTPVFITAAWGRALIALTAVVVLLFSAGAGYAFRMVWLP